MLLACIVKPVHCKFPGGAWVTYRVHSRSRLVGAVLRTSLLQLSERNSVTCHSTLWPLQTIVTTGKALISLHQRCYNIGSCIRVDCG